MAPEQLIRGGVVDHRTDLYAAGVVLYELLTGQRLYEAGPEPDYRALAKKVAKGEHKMPSESDPALEPYDDLVATALRPKPDDRYQTAAEFRDAIQQALVAVNPTISTDQLGSYMRELFSVEMTAQRELHERVAKAHLEDFQDELTKETGTTVSFAMANLPLRADGEPAPRSARQSGRVKAIPGAQRPRSPTRPTDILEQPVGPPPTAAIPTTELALADGTGAVEPSADPETSYRPTVAPAKGRAPLVIALLAAAAVIVVLGVMLSRKDKPQQVAAKPPEPAKSQIRVESIPDDPPGDEPSAVEEPKVVPSTEPKIEPEEPRQPVDKKRKGDKKVEKKVEKVADPKSELTRDAVIAKFLSVRQAYDAYKAKNGGRYDQEWIDLASYLQYHPNELEETARRIEVFRAKLRE
jgi:hypothetical protein